MSHKTLLIEPYYAGSHRQLIDLLHSELTARNDPSSIYLVTMTGKKWHWRARTSALHLSQVIPHINYRFVFASCVLPLHELLALRPELHGAKKMLYFHENQLVYPVRKSKDRDFQYGYNQVMSCLVADQVIFNSKFNMDSFLDSLPKFFKLQPDYRPKNLLDTIKPKCTVLYFPLCFNDIASTVQSIPLPVPGDDAKCHKKTYRILWPHRWEFDKNPDLFFQTLYQLVDHGVTNFRLSILGQTFTDNLDIFAEAKLRLAEFIDHFGYLPSKLDYYAVVNQSDIVVSTASHEFFGVAMMEAVYLGCFPLCPNRLVYPELFGSECIFDGEKALFQKLKTILNCPSPPQFSSPIDFSLYDWHFLKSSFLSLFNF